MLMNKVLDLVSKFCCFILSGILFFVIFFYLLLNTSTKVVNKENVVELFSNLDIEMVGDKGEFDNICEEYELKDNDKKIVYGVDQALRNRTSIDNIQGNYQYWNEEGKNVYKTFNKGTFKNVMLVQVGTDISGAD